MIGPYVCYACGKRTRGVRPVALQAMLEDDGGALVPVGPDCYRKTRRPDGYAPPKGGPRLFHNAAQRADYLERRG